MNLKFLISFHLSYFTPKITNWKASKKWLKVCPKWPFLRSSQVPCDVIVWYFLVKFWQIESEFSGLSFEPKKWMGQFFCCKKFFNFIKSIYIVAVLKRNCFPCWEKRSRISNTHLSQLNLQFFLSRKRENLRW